MNPFSVSLLAVSACPYQGHSLIASPSESPLLRVFVVINRQTNKQMDIDILVILFVVLIQMQDDAKQTNMNISKFMVIYLSISIHLYIYFFYSQISTALCAYPPIQLSNLFIDRHTIVFNLPLPLSISISITVYITFYIYLVFLIIYI